VPSKSGSHRYQKPTTQTEAEWKAFANGIRRHITCYRPHDKLIFAGILALESGLPLRKWYALRSGAQSGEKGKWTRLPARKEWDSLCHYFGIRSEEDLKTVLDLADLQMRIDRAIPDTGRERLDLSVRRLARKENPTAPEARYHPPNRTRDLAPLVTLVNRAPSYLGRWYVSRLISELHLLAWEGSDTERKRAREFGLRLGKAVTQALGRGRRRAFSLEVFRYTAVLYDKLNGDALTFSKQCASAGEAQDALRRMYPRVPNDHLKILVSVGRSSQTRTHRQLFLGALRKRFSIKSDRHVYRLLPGWV
jgi:hypothetical protein